MVESRLSAWFIHPSTIVCDVGNSHVTSWILGCRSVNSWCITVGYFFVRRGFIFCLLRQIIKLTAQHVHLWIYFSIYLKTHLLWHYIVRNGKSHDSFSADLQTALVNVEGCNQSEEHMSCTWGFGYATKSKGAANRRCEKTFCAFTVSRFWPRVSAGSLLRLKSFYHTAFLFVQQTTMSS